MVTRVGNDDPNTINGTSDNDFLSGKGGSRICTVSPATISSTPEPIRIWIRQPRLH